MRFIGITGVIAKVKNAVSSAASVSEDDVKQSKKLAEILRQTLLRVSALEARMPPDGTEFEVEVSTAGATVTLQHKYSQPVRWWVTVWTRPVSGGAYPTIDPVLVQDASSDANTLVLRSYVAGRAVIRVEPSVGVMEA